MGEQTAIAWTDHTFNPWIGCSRVSPGCQHCYAEALDKRWGNDHWGKAAPRRVTADANWRQPVKWNREAAEAGRKDLVFCASMADVFEDRPDLVEPRARLFELILATPNLTWQLLTKRPENIAGMVPPLWLERTYIEVSDSIEGIERPLIATRGWPHNVWVGTTVEDTIRADERIPFLMGIPSRVRFLSCEPLLDRVDISDYLRLLPAGAIGWVIAGGESGPGHRPLDLAHARDLRDQCQQYGVPFFFKQVGGHKPTAGGDLLDGVQHKDFPIAAVA